MQQTRRRIRKSLQISAGGLKVCSAVLLFLANIGRIVIEKGYLHLDAYTQAELLDAMTGNAALTGWVGVASVLQLLEGLVIPIFAFLLVEGFLHTSHFPRYLTRVAVLALMSEIPYDLAISGRAFDWSAQNPVIGVAVCLVMLYCMSRLEQSAGVEKVIGSLLLMLCAAFWVVALRVTYGLQTVLLCAILYGLRNRELAKMLLGILVSLTGALGPLAFILIFLYNGQLKRKTFQYAYYAIYPLQLMLLWVVCQWFF